jgi:hypothetical protein
MFVCLFICEIEDEEKKKVSWTTSKRKQKMRLTYAKKKAFLLD